MHKRSFFRMLVFGMLFAVPIAIIAFVFVDTSAHAQFTAQSTEDCAVCHPAFQEAWEVGVHGQAATDPAFMEAWAAQGQPAMCMSCHTTGFNPENGTWKEAGVGCEACHSPLQPNHPMEPMAAERSASLCGECHTETFFEWQASGHRQEDLNCISCHDPHGTALKTYDASSLCAACHRDRASNFAHSAHSAEGLTCANCHLGPLEGDTGEGHAVRDHSFDVRLSTCNECHAYQMHDPVEVHPEPQATPEGNLASSEMTIVRSEPGPINPLGFATLAGLVGMATGMILAPWLERWYKRINQEEDL